MGPVKDSLGCTEMCGDGSSFILDHQRWQGLLTLPRSVTADPVTNTLVMFPIDEISTLRLTPPLHSMGAVLLGTVEAAAVHRIAGGSATPVPPPTTPSSLYSSDPSLETVNKASGLQDDSPINLCQRPILGPTSGYATAVLVPEVPSALGPERRRLEVRIRFGIEGRSWPQQHPARAGATPTPNGSSGDDTTLVGGGLAGLEASHFEVGITLLTGRVAA